MKKILFFPAVLCLALFIRVDSFAQEKQILRILNWSTYYRYR